MGSSLNFLHAVSFKPYCVYEASAAKRLFWKENSFFPWKNTRGEIDTAEEWSVASVRPPEAFLRESEPFLPLSLSVAAAALTAPSAANRGGEGSCMFSLQHFTDRSGGLIN